MGEAYLHKKAWVGVHRGNKVLRGLVPNIVVGVGVPLGYFEVDPLWTWDFYFWSFFQTLMSLG